MKIIFAIFLFIIALSAKASYYATHCSNASGSVKWATGHASNTITFEEKSLSLGEVEIKSDSETTILEVVSRCNFDQTRIYVAQVKIAPAIESSTVLDFLGRELPLKETVICEFHMSSRGRCD